MELSLFPASDLEGQWGGRKLGGDAAPGDGKVLRVMLGVDD